MAFISSNGTSVPHATDYSDLLDVFITWLTGLSLGWSLIGDNRGTSGDVYLKGTGNDGADKIYVGIQKYTSAGNDNYAWVLQGATSYQAGVSFHAQTGTIPNRPPCLSLWNDPIPYWFAANKRHFRIMAKLGSLYVPMYGGLFLPFGSKGNWPSPLCIGGNNYTDTSFVPPRFDDTSSKNSAFVCPIDTGEAFSSLAIRDAAGVWLRPRNRISTINAPGAAGQYLYTADGVLPYNIVAGNGLNTGEGIAREVPSQDGKYPLNSCVICRPETPDLLGVFDGIKHTPGFSISPEDDIPDGTDTWRAFTNVFRTGRQDFFAFREA